MKKLTIILATLLSLSFNLNASIVHHWLYCNAAGQAYIVDQLGNSVPVGGCMGGPWATQLDLVVPGGGPSVPEASPAVYEVLNTPASNPEAQPSTTERTEINTAIQNSNVKVWVNPLKLTTAAYNLLYGGTTSLPLFYANPSLDVSTGTNYLSLYSDGNRTVSVTYKTLNFSVLSSENFSLVSGYNLVTLNTISLSNGTYIITASTNSEQVNRTLVVNH